MKVRDKRVEKVEKNQNPTRERDPFLFEIGAWRLCGRHNGPRRIQRHFYICNFLIVRGDVGLKFFFFWIFTEFQLKFKKYISFPTFHRIGIFH